MPPVNSGKARWWILTIPHHLWVPFLQQSMVYCRGQVEVGEETSYLHWQIVVAFGSQQRLSGIKKLFGEGVHAEPTRSEAALEYVWKEDTAVQGTRFELGKRPFVRNRETDWDEVVQAAKNGNILDSEAIPSDVLVRCYGSLRSIAKDCCRPVYRGTQEVNVFWGVSDAGKTWRAFQEAGEDYYLKDPLSRWWDGYRGEANIVIDEFCGTGDVINYLKWLDKYPCLVEVKGSQVALKSKKWWIMTNVRPEHWFLTCTPEQKVGLLRRLTNVVEFTTPYTGPRD